MVSNMRYLFLLLLPLLVACGKNKFTLDFDVASDVTDNYNVTYYATDLEGGLTIQAVASLREGRCELEGVTKRPTLVYVSTRKTGYPMVMYVKRGEKIKIEGTDKNPLGWIAENNDINRTLSDWRKENLDALVDNKADSVNLSISRFVEENTDNPVSTLLMLCYYDRSINENEYEALMASLKGNAKDEEWFKITSRADNLVKYYAYPASLESIVMRSVKDGADTLRLNKRDPVILFFWQTGWNERKQMIDSIKVIENEFPDSVRIIADICLDPDSVGWRNAIKKDTLANVKRFWTPLGAADPTATKLKVNSLPYYIVFDKDGKQTYRGKEMGEALDKYRMLHNEKDSI